MPGRGGTEAVARGCKVMLYSEAAQHRFRGCSEAPGRGGTGGMLKGVR